MHDDYGPAVRFTPTEVSFITAEAMNKIYGHKPSGSLAFSKDTKIVYRRSGKYSSIIGANDEEHRRMRRLLAHAFSDNALRSQQVVLNRYVDLFIERVMPLAESGSGVVDLVRWYNFATFDVIGDLAFGRSFGCLESGGYNPWVRMIFANIKSYSFLIVLRRMSLEGLASLLTPSHLKRSVKEHKYLSEQTVMDRIASGNTEREDFISYILKHDGEKTMVTQEIIETAETLIVAGSETTATLLSGVTYQLLMNRDKLDILVEEIRSSFASVEDMTLQRVGQLPYLLAVLNEGLRMRMYTNLYPISTAQAANSCRRTANTKRPPQNHALRRRAHRRLLDPWRRKCSLPPSMTTFEASSNSNCLDNGVSRPLGCFQEQIQLP